MVSCLAIGYNQVSAVQWHTHTDSTTISDAYILPDSLPQRNLSDTLRSIVSLLHHGGHLEASIDSLEATESMIQIFLHVGPTYTLGHLDVSDIPPPLQGLPELNINKNERINYQEIATLFDFILEYAENHGYPFASVHLDDIEIRDQVIKARLLVDLNDTIYIESIDVRGDLKLKHRYLSHFLNLQTGELFSKEKVLSAPEQLSSLPYIDAYQTPTVDFLGNSARVHLHLNKKNANQFDILLGLLPSPDPNRRFQLTGNINIDMYNQFAAGERIHLNFENLQPGVQELEIDFNYPFIFDWPFGLDAHFDLYKRDSTYIDLGYHLGLQYLISGHNYLSFFTESDGTNILHVDTSSIIQTKKLPQNIDVRRNLFGSEFHHESLDYRPNPRKGHSMNIRASIGSKRVAKNLTITSLKDPENESFDFNTLYDDLDLRSFQFRTNVDISIFLPLFQSSTLLLSNKTGWIKSGESLFQNELYRIGGTKTLRGFNEEVIFANFYNISTLEYRLLIDRNSNIFTFFDFGYYDQHTTSNRISDRPFGFGLGLNLATKIGIFSISYAVGKDRNESLNFRNGRVHFGMVTQF